MVVESIRTALEPFDRVFVVGSGGVGKTTAAAAIGVATAIEHASRVLVVTVDPAKRLASTLGVAPLANTPVEIPLDHFVAPKGQLFAATVDMKRAWDALVDRFSPDSQIAQRILSNPIYHNLSSKFIGSYDYAAVEVLAELTSTSRYDLVIVDTPPSRNALDFLDAPSRLREFFSSPLLSLLTLPRRTKVFHAATKPFFLVADQILGSAFLADLTDFFADFSRLGDGLVRQSQEFSQLLSARTTGFLTVSLPYGPSAGEAAHLLGALERRGLNRVGYLLNRSWPSTFFDEGAIAAARVLSNSPEPTVEELTARETSSARRASALRMLTEVAVIYDQLVSARGLEATGGGALWGTVASWEVPVLDDELTSTRALADFFDAIEPVTAVTSDKGTGR
ncbi:MAG: ArsA family ATPase [Ferrimicrobium sp.]